MNTQIINKHFNTDKYVRVDCFLSREIAKMIGQSAVYTMLNSKEDERGGDEQVPAKYTEYSNPIMESLLLYCKNRMEEITGLELCPSYSYFRIYQTGNELKNHVDRESCEISATVTLAYKNDATLSPWPIWIKGEDGNVSSIALHEGDAIIYRGEELEHWREPMDGNEDSFQVQVFLHYIDKNGPYYPKFVNDKRPCIGIKKENIR